MASAVVLSLEALLYASLSFSSFPHPDNTTLSDARSRITAVKTIVLFMIMKF
jgi:hypothetical protein